MTADLDFPVVQQTDYFVSTETFWRGVVNSEDLTIGALRDVLALATASGMPDDALVSFPDGGDLVTKVHITTRKIERAS